MPTTATLAAASALAFGLAAMLTSSCSDPIVLECTSVPIEIDGFATGYATCGTFRHRPKTESCPVFEPAAVECATEEGVEAACLSHADCDDAPFGLCREPTAPDVGCSCSYGCRADEDCEEGAICVCGEPFGTCARATCKTDDSCEEGSLCAEAPVTVCELGARAEFGCLQPADECVEAGDCVEAGARCVLGHDGLRTCQVPDNCVVP